MEGQGREEKEEEGERRSIQGHLRLLEGWREEWNSEGKDGIVRWREGQGREGKRRRERREREMRGEQGHSRLPSASLPHCPTSSFTPLSRIPPISPYSLSLPVLKVSRSSVHGGALETSK